MKEKEKEEITPKKNNIALKITTDSENSDEDEDEDIALLIRKFKRFIRRGKF